MYEKLMNGNLGCKYIHVFCPKQKKPKQTSFIQIFFYESMIENNTFILTKLCPEPPEKGGK